MIGAPPLLTVWHGTYEQDDFVALLRSAGVETVVDLLIAPGSQPTPPRASGPPGDELVDNGAPAPT